MKAYLFAVLLLLAIFVPIAGYKFFQFSALSNASFERPPITVAADIAKEENWEEHLDAIGTIRAVRGINLTSEESGEIIRINFRSGEKVKKDQLLVVLNDRVEVARRESQKATLELAQIQFDRNKKLIRQNSISEADYDRARADLERAQADLAETDAVLANKRIRAPFAGTTGILQVELGDYVSPGDVLASLQDLSELEIDFTLPAQKAPLLKAGQRIALSVDAFPERTFEARLIAIDSQIDPNTRNLMARAEIESGKGLLPGMFAYLKLFPGISFDLVTVPQTAVSYSLHGNIVHLLEPEENQTRLAKAIVVTTGDTRDGRTRIISGIESGDQVVTAGQNKLYRGARVVVDENVAF